jgi:two-component system, sensor histidine kinase and response regulator
MDTGDLMCEVDIDDMLSRLGGDRDLVTDLCRLFLEVCPEQLRTLESAVAQRDLTAAERAAHLFKSSAGSISASKVANAAAMLEEAARTGRAADLGLYLAVLKSDVDRLVTELRSQYAGGGIAHSDR